MRPYNPYYIPQDPEDYREYLSREFRNLKDSLDQIHDLEVSSVPVEPPREGMVRYADGVNWDPLGFYAERGYGKGPYYYNGEFWLPMFAMPKALWAQVLSTDYTVTGAWTTFITLNVRTFFAYNLILTTSFECGGTSSNKLLDIGLRYRINGQPVHTIDPTYGFSYNFGANSDQATWHSVDMPLILKVENYITPVTGQAFYDISIEVQALTNSVSTVTSGYLEAAEK